VAEGSSAEGSGRTVEAAIEAARKLLGVPRDWLEVEVVQEPVPGSFGRVGSPARVMVSVREPSQAPAGEQEAAPQAPARDAGRVDGGRPEPRRAAVERAVVQIDPELAAQQAELAADFVEGLLELLDLEADIYTSSDPTGGRVEVEGPDLGVLVGRDGDVLGSLEELTRLAVVRRSGERVRLSLDIDGFRQHRREVVMRSARETAERVLRQGLPEELPPMPAYERKIVHDVIAEMEGVQTESVGEEPRRRVSIIPG
jgi:spoIIIJ-associated protein